VVQSPQQLLSKASHPLLSVVGKESKQCLAKGGTCSLECCEKRIQTVSGQRRHLQSGVLRLLGGTGWPSMRAASTPSRTRSSTTPLAALSIPLCAVALVVLSDCCTNHHPPLVRLSALSAHMTSQGDLPSGVFKYHQLIVLRITLSTDTAFILLLTCCTVPCGLSRHDALPDGPLRTR